MDYCCNMQVAVQFFCHRSLWNRAGAEQPILKTSAAKRGFQKTAGSSQLYVSTGMKLSFSEKANLLKPPYVLEGCHPARPVGQG